MNVSTKIMKAMLAKSGNECAFPGCNEKIVDENNSLIGELAHIEAKSEFGARYNKNQTEIERNGITNLIYLCPNHHKKIDKNPEKYSVDVLKNMKKDHENNCNKYDFNWSKIYEANIDLQNYLERMKQTNELNENYYKVLMKENPKFDELINEIRGRLEYMDDLKTELLNFFSSISFSESLFLSENEDLNYKSFWEKLAIGLGNSLVKINLNATLIEILYYTEYLKFNNDANFLRNLNDAKEHLEELLKNETYFD